METFRLLSFGKPAEQDANSLGLGRSEKACAQPFEPLPAFGASCDTAALAVPPA
jgi:hypothetical protein